MGDKNWPPTLELPTAGKHSNGSGKEVRYKIEVRTTYSQPSQIGGVLVDNIWRELRMEESQCGVPVRRSFSGDAHGTLNYEAAQALRWWFMAVAEAEPLGSLCIETRLVAVQLSYSYSIEEIGLLQEIGTDYRRTLDIPRPRKAPVAEVPDKADPS
jgi:hypothetical protein